MGMKNKDQKSLLVCGFCTEDVIGDKSYFGGAAGGIALNASNLGLRVGLLSVLGQDNFSQKYKAELEEKGISTELIDFSARQLPRLTIQSDENTEASRTFDDNGAKKVLENLEPEPSQLNDYSLLHVVNVPRKLCDYLADTFTGVISYCPGSFLYRDSSTLSMKVLEKAQLVFANEEEYGILAKNASVGDLLDKNLKYLVVTKGKAGVDVYEGSNITHYDAPEIKIATDTTGAGDAFFVGFISAYLKKSPLESCVMKGMSLAAEIVTKNGVIL